MKRQTQPATNVRSAASFAPAKRRILIVENEPRVHRRLIECLDSDEGTFDAVWTQTAHESLRRSLDERFDLVLLDLNVSDMDGWKALDWFNKLHPFLPVVVLADQPGQARRSTALGAGAGLEKPVDALRLLDTINQLLSESYTARVTRMTASTYGHPNIH